MLTNGKFRGIEHRAVTNKDTERLSVVTFHAPRFDAGIGLLPQFIDDAQPCLYRTYKHPEYKRHYISNKLEGKKSLDFAKVHTS